MKRTIYSVIASVSFVLAMLNGNAQTVSYRVMKDDPTDIAKLQVRIQPFFAEGFRLNKASLGTALELRYNLQDKMLFNAHRWGSFSTIAEGPNNEKFKLSEIGTEYILADKSSKQDISVVLKSSTSQDRRGTYTTSKYIDVPGTSRTLIAARGALVHYTSPFKPYMLKKIDLAQIKDTAGVSLSGLDVSGTTMSATVIAAGVSVHKITNLHVLVDDRMKRSQERWVSLYFDVLFAPVVKVQDFGGRNAAWVGSWFVISNGDNGIERKRLGWRYGMVGDFHSEKRVTFGGRVELGSRPGIKDNGFYLRAGLGMTINLL